MTPATLVHTRLSSHLGLPSPEPMAEHSRSKLMYGPTRSQLHRIWFMAADITLATMCAGQLVRQLCTSVYTFVAATRPVVAETARS